MLKPDANQMPRDKNNFMKMAELVVSMLAKLKLTF